MKKRIFFKNAVILIAVSFFVRFCSIIFRSYLAGRLGAAGMGVYQLVFSVFVTAVALSTSGLNLLSMRLTARCFSENKGGRLKSSLFKCVVYGACLSAFGGTVLCIFAGPIATGLLSDPRVEDSLRILALGLPFMSCTAVFKGYFTAVKKTVHCAAADISEQLVTMGFPAAFFFFGADYGIERSIEIIMWGSTLGEITSLLYTLLMYLKMTGAYKRESYIGIWEDIRHIALPGTLSSTARTLLGTIENLLIPFGLKAGGLSIGQSLSQYGILHGMALPALVFPSSLLLPFSSLLVPEIAEAISRKHMQTVSRLISKAIRFTFMFSLLAACMFYVYSGEIGMLMYKSETAGSYIRILSPLILLMYADCVVDGILKGLDQQTASCKYNLIDGALRVVLIYFLLPRMGMSGYIAIIFFSTIFNASLSFSKLIRVSRITVPLFEYLFLPLFYSAVSVFISKIIGGDKVIVNIMFGTAVYILLVIINGSFGKTVKADKYAKES